MNAPTHRVITGPHAGLLCRVHATGGLTTAVTYARPGWRFPVFAVVRNAELAPIEHPMLDGEPGFG